MVKDDLLKVKTLYAAICKIEKFTEDMKSKLDLTSNDLVWDAVKMNLVVIAEMDIKIGSEIKEKFNTVAWHKIKEKKTNINNPHLGFDPDEIWEAIQNELPSFKLELEKAINQFGLNV